MTIQVLVVTMNQTDYSLLDKMNIQTDAIVCNQCDRYDYSEFNYKGHNIKWFSFAERGVGINRNNALMRATADISVFADDDVVYVDGYDKIIKDYYKKNPKADAVFFNFEVFKGGRSNKTVKQERRLSFKNATSFGTVSITAKTNKIKMNNINFHRGFGGGTEFSCGEDTLFIKDCCKKLKVYSCLTLLGRVNNEESTWFKGYNDKFFYDKGVLYYCLDKTFCKLMALYHCYKHRRIYKAYGWKKAYKMMKKGINEFIKI